jgi:hypothetical protein
MDSIETWSLEVGPYRLLEQVATGESLVPVTEPKIAHMEKLLADGLVRRDGMCLLLTAEGHDVLRSWVYSTQTGRYHKPVRRVGSKPR